MIPEKAVQEAILQERQKRGYHVMIGPVKRAYWVAENRIPDGLEGYHAIAECTEHAPPCTWVDFAFRMGDGFKVMLQNDFLREGMMIMQSARVVLEELATEANTQP